MSTRDYFDDDGYGRIDALTYTPGRYKQQVARTKRNKDGDGVNIAAMAAALSGNIDNAIVASTPGGIEAQERRAVEKAITGMVVELAIDMRPAKVVWESLGFTFQDPSSSDSVVVKATLPTGWALKPSKEDSRHITIFDEKNQPRGSMFYKSTFYDTYARMSLNARYSVGSDYDSPNKRSRFYAYDIMDPEKRLKEFRWVPIKEDDEEARKSMCKGLDEMYPGWTDPTKYW